MTGSWEVVARILQRQELLHESQVEQWKTTVNEANQKLMQVSPTGRGEVDSRAFLTPHVNERMDLLLNYWEMYPIDA